MANDYQWNPGNFKTQANKVLAYMMQGKRITPIEALNLFGSMRLSAIIFALRERGYIIQTERVRTGTNKWVSSYWINEEDMNQNIY